MLKLTLTKHRKGNQQKLGQKQYFRHIHLQGNKANFIVI